uniref:Uncharacterized protein n=1 Tax=viral metagenome TaxID=1070528 RepID=A0A6C0I032_9ZZZZ
MNCSEPFISNDLFILYSYVFLIEKMDYILFKKKYYFSSIYSSFWKNLFII